MLSTASLLWQSHDSDAIKNTPTLMLHSSWVTMQESVTFFNCRGHHHIGNTPTFGQPAICQVNLHAQTQAGAGYL